MATEKGKYSLGGDENAGWRVWGDMPKRGDRLLSWGVKWQQEASEWHSLANGKPLNTLE